MSILSFKLPSFDAETCAVLCFAGKTQELPFTIRALFPGKAGETPLTESFFPARSRASLSLTSSHYVAVPFKPLLMISTLGSGHHRCSSSGATKQVRKVIQLKNNTFHVFFFFFLYFLPRLFVSGSLFWSAPPRRWCHITAGSVRMGMWTAGATCSRDLCCWDKDMPTSEVTFMQHHSYSLLGSCRTLLEQGMWWLQ